MEADTITTDIRTAGTIVNITVTVILLISIKTVYALMLQALTMLTAQHRTAAETIACFMIYVTEIIIWQVLIAMVLSGVPKLIFYTDKLNSCQIFKPKIYSSVFL